MFFSFEDEMFTCVSDEVGSSVPKKFWLLSLFVCFSSFFFWFFFLLLLLHSKRNKERLLLHTTTTQQQTQRKNNNKRKSIDRSSSNQNARRATIGRVLRRTRERARREAIERDRSSSGGEHREEQFRTRWVGQGIIVKILFSNREKVNVGIAMDRFFFSLSLSLSAESASSRSTFGGSFITRRNTDHRSSSLTSSFLF